MSVVKPLVVRIVSGRRMCWSDQVLRRSSYCKCRFQHFGVRWMEYSHLFSSVAKKNF